MFNKLIIYKDNLISNIKQVKQENKNSKICAMVKANAYGVGVEQVAKILDEYADFFGVACFFEAKQLRKQTKKPILIVGSFSKEEIDVDFSYACSSLDDLMMIISQNKKVKIHFKINTGMNRFGFKDLKQFKKALMLAKKNSIIVEGIFTHFATTDDYVFEQMQRFEKFVKLCKNAGFSPCVHADNSFVNEKFNHNLDMVRVGYNLYNNDKGWFLPVVEIKSAVVNLIEVSKGELVGYDYRCVAKKKMKVAVVPIGYADGFDLKYIGMELKVDGVLCEILNVCMDCFMIDVSKTSIKKGDDLFVLNKFNSLKSFSKYINSSPYEVMTKFSQIRAERVIV